MNVLIADDVPTNLKLLRAELEAEGHTVFEAPNGAEALKILEREKVEAIISDVLMPEMDGYQLCYQVRKDDRFKLMPFIFYTATYVSPSDERVAFALGADKFLRKPASGKVLKETLAEVSSGEQYKALRRLDTPQEAAVIKEYCERLVAKLEQKNAEVAARNEQLLQGMNTAFTTLAGYTAEEVLQRSNEQLHILSHRLFQVQEDERRHLAREIHDQLGQMLTAATINLHAAKQLTDPVAMAQLLDETIAILHQLLEQTQQISLDLRPPLLDDLGLVPALRWYLDQQAQRAGFHVEFFADPALERVGAEIETACFRVTQEALTNAVRHGGAQRVGIELRRAPDAVRLTVRDDGKGFDVAAAMRGVERGQSLGLLGMRERVSLLGGQLDVKSTPGLGTEVYAFFPIAPEAGPREVSP